jgi:TonB family protein
VLRNLPWLWLAGTVLLLGRIALGYTRVARFVRVVGRVEVAFADVSVPVVVGLRRAVILLPHAAQTWPPDRTDAALRHERAHVRRNDLWTLLLTHLACAVYWFHPMVWMVAAQLRREQEQACDDAVILSGFEPATYAEALLAAAHNLTSTRLTGCHMITQKTFRSRISRLLASGVPRVSSSSTLRGAAIVFAGAVITISLLNGKPQSPDENGVYKVGNGISAPSLVSRVDPEYSEEARAEKLDGSVLLSIVVGTDGLAHDINVVKSLGSGLDEKAVQAVQKWHFKPGEKNGQPVNVRAQIEINFRLM